MNWNRYSPWDRVVMGLHQWCSWEILNRGKGTRQINFDLIIIRLKVWLAGWLEVKLNLQDLRGAISVNKISATSPKVTFEVKTNSILTTSAKKKVDYHPITLPLTALLDTSDNDVSQEVFNEKISSAIVCTDNRLCRWLETSFDGARFSNCVTLI